HMDDEVALSEIRQERAAEERERRHRAETERQGRPQQERRPTRQPPQEPAVQPLQREDEARLRPVAEPAGQERQRQGGRDRHGDELADGYGGPPELQGIERETQAVEHDARPQQGEGDRRQRDERRAQVEEEDEEDDRDEDAAEEQRLHDVVDGGLHEAGGPEER